MSERCALLCARCGQPAAVFALVAAREGEEPVFHSARLERTGFMGTVTKFGTMESLGALLAALRDRNYAGAREADPDFVAFHCRGCDADYCERCWRIGPMEFDEGFYDCTRGTCPNGHEQIVDD